MFLMPYIWAIDNSESLLEMQMSKLERSLKINKSYTDFMQKFDRLFDRELRCDSRQREFMRGVGGFDQIREPEYIRDIFKITKDIWLLCEGDMQHYPEAVRMAYQSYEKQGDFCKMSVLRNAVGGFVD